MVDTVLMTESNTQGATTMMDTSERTMQAYDAYSRNTDRSQDERLLAEYRAAARRELCSHDNVELDETQVDVDRFESEPVGTCEDCGLRVEWECDWDDEGKSYYLTELDEWEV